MTVSHNDMANAIRFLSVDAIENARAGHPGTPMGAADEATVLFSRYLKFDPAAPTCPDRERFILSSGHACLLLYSLLYLTGYEEMTLEQLRSVRQFGSRTPGHPEYDPATGVETTTGPLGQGLAAGVGMALAERLLNARFGDNIVDHYTYVLEAVAAGRGIALGWRGFFDQYVQSGTVAALTEKFVELDSYYYGVLTKKGRSTPLARRCLDFLKQSIEQRV